jgi:hypothetical protein
MVQIFADLRKHVHPPVLAAIPLFTMLVPIGVLSHGGARQNQETRYRSQASMRYVHTWKNLR